MADLLLPEELPSVLLSNIARFYHRTDRMWGYLPSSINLSHLTSREKEAAEIITIQLFPKVHYRCLRVKLTPSLLTMITCGMQSRVGRFIL